MLVIIMYTIQDFYIHRGDSHFEFDAGPATSAVNTHTSCNI